MKYLEKHPIIMIIIGIIGISVSSIFVRYSTAPSIVTAAFRLSFTSLLMTPMVFTKRSVKNELFATSKTNLLLSILSGMFLALHFSFMFEALKHTSVASTTSIIATEVIWVSLGYCLVLKGKLSIKAVLTVIFTLMGSVLIAFGDKSSGGHLYGDMLALFAAIAVAVYMLIGGVVRKTTSTTVYTYLVYTSGATVLLLTSFITSGNIFHFGLSPVIVGLLLAVFSTMMGHSIFSWCLKYFTPSFVSTCKLLEPVVAAIIAVFLFNELPTIHTIIGSVMILSGVYYYSKIEQQKN